MKSHHQALIAAHLYFTSLVLHAMLLAYTMGHLTFPVCEIWLNIPLAQVAGLRDIGIHSDTGGGRSGQRAAIEIAYLGILQRQDRVLPSIERLCEICATSKTRLACLNQSMSLQFLPSLCKPSWCRRSPCQSAIYIFDST